MIWGGGCGGAVGDGRARRIHAPSGLNRHSAAELRGSGAKQAQSGQRACGSGPRARSPRTRGCAAIHARRATPIQIAARPDCRCGWSGPLPWPRATQGDLALGIPAPDSLPTLTAEDFIRALNFPKTADDAAGFRSLRKALKDPRAGRLVQASQDVLTLLSRTGFIWMILFRTGHVPISGANSRMANVGSRLRCWGVYGTGPVCPTQPGACARITFPRHRASFPAQFDMIFAAFSIDATDRRNRRPVRHAHGAGVHAGGSGGGNLRLGVSLPGTPRPRPWPGASATRSWSVRPTCWAGEPWRSFATRSRCATTCASR